MIPGNPNPLKIAVLVRLFPNIVQTYVLNHIISLQTSGNMCTIVAEHDPEQAEVHPNIERYNLLSKTQYINTDASNIFKNLLSLPIYNPQYLSVIIKLITSNIWKKHGLNYGLKSLLRSKVLLNGSFETMHSHSLINSYQYLFLKEHFSIPLTTTFHGLIPKNIPSLDADKIKTTLKLGDAFFVNTKFARDQLIELGCSIDKINIIPQGTNTDDFPFSPQSISKGNDITVLSVGRLSIEKGFHIAINAIAGLIKHYPTLKYRIVGGGHEEANLRQQIAELGLQNSIDIFGSITTELLLEHYSDAHIFILPSIDFRDGTHTETQGVVLQEAQSSGTPVIASRTGGIPEIIKDGHTGLLFDEENIEQLTDCIKSLIEDKHLYNKLQTQGRRDVEDNYSIEVICDRLTDVYRKVISKNSHANIT